ncbi:MAG: acyl-protein synthase [Bdellovibrionales bacterium]|nr:acyl-protein synthase [Bdellovibrionales bacterium]MBT3524894.1 acyl-protein synthase [Bdellovibrionales bacterium]
MSPPLPMIPNASELPSLSEWASQQHPYQVQPGGEALFLSAFKEIVQWHYRRSPLFASMINASDIDLDTIDREEQLWQIPPLLASFVKRYELLSVDRKEISLHLTSSGTSGEHSQVYFDQWSIGVAQTMVDKIFSYNKWVETDTKCNYLLYSYQPEESSKLGTAYTDNFLCKYAPINSVHYALRLKGGGGHHFDLFGVIDRLQQFSQQGLPVRIFGFPSFLFFTLQQMEQQGIPPLKLHPDSLVFLGGGWKGYAEQQVSKGELYSLAHRMLGIPAERLRDGFGSVEHCIPYIECRHHNFHQPVWSRVVIRDVKSWKPLGFGKVGQLNFISPYITSMPLISVLMGDLAVLYPGSSCPCEIDSPYFIIKGRASVKSGRSCAVAAAELLTSFAAKSGV